MSEWHALAKLRMHTNTSLELMEEYTWELGVLLRQFQWLTCFQFSTVELLQKADAHAWRKKEPTTGPNTQLSETMVPISVSQSYTTINIGQYHDQNSIEKQVPNDK